MKSEDRQKITIGSIVQANPEICEWGPSLVIVTGLKRWGVTGYTHIPFQGDAFIRLKWADIEVTGGVAVWDHDRGSSDEKELKDSPEQSEI